MPTDSFSLEDNAVLREPFKNQSDFKIKKREYVLALLITLDEKHINHLSVADCSGAGFENRLATKSRTLCC